MKTFEITLSIEEFATCIASLTVTMIDLDKNGNTEEAANVSGVIKKLLEGKNGTDRKDV